MQRVLSFQMARGFGESSEFVTKRMCFSFIFSVGFISLLCGFLLGRFAAERTAAYRTEKKLLELSGNGLDSTDYLRHLLLHQLKAAPFDTPLTTNSESTVLQDDDKHLINNVTSNLSLIPRLVDHKSCITASIRGSRESDRYVVVAASNQGIAVVFELLNALSEIHREYGWRPRRTLIFCMFAGNEDSCLPLFSSVHSKITAYVALYGRSLKVGEQISATGTEIALATVSEAVSGMHSDNNLLSVHRSIDPIINASHVMFSFADNNSTHPENHEERKVATTILAQIVSQTVWRFSERLVIKWDPTEFNKTRLKTLQSFNSTELRVARGMVENALNELVLSVEILNNRIDVTESTRSLDLRMFNDLLMDLDRTLVCSNEKMESTMSGKASYVAQQLPTVHLSYLNRMTKCYETAINILYDW